MICKKTKEILKQREKDRTAKKKAQEQIDEEVRIAVNEKICPYCAGKITSPIWSYDKCYNCNKEFIKNFSSENEIKTFRRVRTE